MTSGKKNYNYLPDAIVVEGPKAGGHLGFKKEQIQDQHYALEALIPGNNDRRGLRTDRPTAAAKREKRRNRWSLSKT